MNKEEKKGYGIVIPAEWKASDFNGSLDDLFAQIVDLDIKAFYRMAESTDIDLELLKNAGYEYQGPSAIALYELENFLTDHIGRARFMSYLRSMPSVSQYMKKDFDYVLGLYNRDNDILSKYYPDDYAEVLKQEVEEMPTTNNPLGLKLMRLFIDEFQDEKTAARQAVLDRYGERFNSLFVFEQFALSRNIGEWYKNENPYKIADIELCESLQELMNVYRLMRDGGRFIIKSVNIRTRKTAIGKPAAKILADMIVMATPHIRHCDFQMGEVEGRFDETGEYIPVMNTDNETVKSIEHELENTLASFQSDQKLGLFYYLADNAIWWPEGMSVTDRYIFLFKLAIHFGYVPSSEIDDFSSAYCRKDIVDKIKYLIKTETRKDLDKKVLRNYIH